MLAAGHVVNDTFSNTLSGLLPVWTAVFSLSYLLAGALAMVFSITSSLMQPLLGHWFDRTQTTWLLEVGLALNCIGMGVTGFSPNFVILLFFVGTAGLGTAAFHPPAFSAVAKAGESVRGGALGLFLAGGNAGYFLGPIVAGALVSYYGLHGTLILIPIGLGTAVLLYRFRAVRSSRTSSITKTTAPAKKSLLALLATITALRSVTITAGTIFLPLYFVTEGYSLLAATAVSSIWLGAGVLGQFGGGLLSDRIGRRPVIAASLFVGSFLFYGFLLSDGLLSHVFLIASGLVIYASWSVIVAMSSEAAPSDVGTVAGLMLGFSVGIGGLAGLGFGAVADAVGLREALMIFTAFSIVGGFFALPLPARIVQADQAS
jgi:FSR family fosmidomycin resistance protein-like MFS transporter